jgi:hypothetical protein
MMIDKLSTQEFSSLPLHDAMLQSIELLWEKKLCRFRLHAFVQKGKLASPYLLEFQDVTALKVPHEELWGSSFYVNSASYLSGNFYIEMQSGDTIEIIARSFTFVASKEH